MVMKETHVHGHEFESRHRILDGHFFTYVFVVKFVISLKRRKKIKKWWGWPFLKKELLRFRSFKHCSSFHS